MEKKLRLLDINVLENRIKDLEETKSISESQDATQAVIDELKDFLYLLRPAKPTREIIGEVYKKGFNLRLKNGLISEFEEENKEYISNLIKE